MIRGQMTSKSIGDRVEIIDENGESQFGTIDSIYQDDGTFLVILDGGDELRLRPTLEH